MPKLLIIRGLPGSGKSTHAKQIVEDSGGKYVHVEADMYFVNHAGRYVFDRTKLGVAHDWCQHQCALALESGQDVVVANTFVKRWEIEPYIKMAKTLGAEVDIIIMYGEYENVHSVPKEVIERMNKSWEPYILENEQSSPKENDNGS